MTNSKEKAVNNVDDQVPKVEDVVYNLTCISFGVVTLAHNLQEENIPMKQLG